VLDRFAMMGAFATLLSPVILFFALGVLAAALRSDLSVPEPMAKAMSLYLMAAIGLKGGVQVSSVGISAQMLTTGATGIILSFALPLVAFALLRSFGRLDRMNAGVVAAHYGSVSIVTFVTANEALTRSGIAPDGYLVAVLALMETPAILTGLLLAQARKPNAADTPAGPTPGGHLWREVFLNGSVVLLLGAFLIGLIVGEEKYKPISPLFTAGFSGVLCLFLLDMGLVAARRLRDSRAMTWRLGIIGVALPLINGSIGLSVALLLGLSVGTTAGFAILCASASYIAVPAAMRMAMPKADPGIYLSMSLAVTFPFNIVIGIALFTALATRFAG
jgi:uncharacterized protein